MKTPNHTRIRLQAPNLLFSQMKNFCSIMTCLLSMHAIATPSLNQSLIEKKPVLLSKEINWNGLYFGGSMGGAWSNNHANFIVPNDTATQQIWDPAIIADLFPTLINFKQSGPIGGGQLGFNYKYSNKVLVGIETDINGANIQGVKSESLANGQQGATPWFGSAGSRLTWLGTVRGRIGYLPIQQALFYATGGVAYGGSKNNYYNSFPEAQPLSLYTSSQTDIQTGYTVGGGLEWMFQTKWSIKAEYLYYNLGNSTDATTPGDLIDAQNIASGQYQTVSNKFSNAGNIIHVGLNYHFS